MIGAAGEVREIRLAGVTVPYVLARRPRRSIGLSIDHRGLRVAAPRRASLREIEQLLQGHTEWVMRKLAEWQRPGLAAQGVLPGCTMPILGIMRSLRPAAVDEPSGLTGHELWVHPQQPFGLFAKAALQGLARAEFTSRIARFAAAMDRPVPAWGLSSARTRWGSCNRAGAIRLNWRLIHVAPALIDYVVVHELAHGVEMNHSPRFWAVVERLLPDYRERRLHLRAVARALPVYDFSL